MTPDDPHSRYAINQRVRSVLVSHDVDLEALSVSSSANVVYINGFLKKGSGGEMRPTDIDLIFREIEQLPAVRGVSVDLENWIVTNAEGSWTVTAKKRAARGGASHQAEDYRIEREEYISDVLEEIQGDKKS
jgi:hypothetical protein